MTIKRLVSACIALAFPAMCFAGAPQSGNPEEAFPGLAGVPQRDVFETPAGPKVLDYRLINGIAVFQGDILLGEPLKENGIDGATRTRRTHLWPEGVVAYTIDSGLPNQTRVTDAIEHWEDNSPIRFVPRTTQADYVTFISSTGCSSSVGQQGGRQYVNLASGCSTGNTIHEIGHTLGLWHEQSRTDRDDHVIIHWDDISPGYESNFKTYKDLGADGRNAGPYDLDSIMHYGSISFSETGEPTITTIDGDLITANRTAVTSIDVCAVRRLYGFGGYSDFNGDGYADLAIGVPYEDITGGTNQGAVMVIYGTAGGLSATDEFLNRGQPGIWDDPASSDYFGLALTVGDFNADCYDDLAVGVPYDDVDGISNMGSVQVFYGGLLGLAVNEVWHRTPSSDEAETLYGYSLESGDFNGDGYHDLAIGMPFNDIGSLTDTGSVTVIYGAADGLSGTGIELWNQNVGSVQDTQETGDEFGFALATGDFDADGFDELAIGIPYEDVGTTADAGAVTILKGSIDGLTDAGNQFFKDSTIETRDSAGYSLAAADFDSDGYVDLAIGVPYQDVGGDADAGAVRVLYGTNTGLLQTGSQTWSQASAGIAGGTEPSDNFGRSLLATDIDADGYNDLIVGVPYEDLSGGINAGGINVIPGSGSGLTSSGNSFWSQDGDIEGKDEAYDNFGASLSVGDFNGDWYPDLVVGVPGEDIGTVVDAGGVNVIPGSSSGLNVAADVFWSQDSLDIQDSAEPSDQAGRAIP